MNNFFAGKVILARKCQIFDPVVSCFRDFNFFHDFNFPARLQLFFTTITFQHDFNFPKRLIFPGTTFSGLLFNITYKCLP